MTPTFVHLGDTHLHPGPRQADRLKALDQIIDENVTLPSLAAWIWPGDLFHQRSTVDDRNALRVRVKRMADVAPVVICPGNHDAPGDLDIFGDLGARYPIYVVATPQVLRVPLALGAVLGQGPGPWFVLPAVDVERVREALRSDLAAFIPVAGDGSLPMPVRVTPQHASIFVLPYPTEAGLVSAGVAPGQVVATAREALEAIFRDAAVQLDAARAAGDLVLMMGHVNVAGSITSSGQPNIGQEIEVDEALLDMLGPCYKGLNHIHRAQQVGGAYYAGSICRLDWGEVEEKSYLRVAVERDGYVVGACPLDVPPMYHVEGWLSRDGFAYSSSTLALDISDPTSRPWPASWKDCEVRVRAKFHQSEKALIEMAKAHVFAEFAEAARFQLELVVVPDGALRAPAVAAAQTLAQKVEAWALETGAVLPADLLAILPSLEHGDGDTLLDAEGRFIAEVLGVVAESEAA